MRKSDSKAFVIRRKVFIYCYMGYLYVIGNELPGIAQAEHCWNGCYHEGTDLMEQNETFKKMYHLTIKSCLIL